MCCSPWGPRVGHDLATENNNIAGKLFSNLKSVFMFNLLLMEMFYLVQEKYTLCTSYSHNHQIMKVSTVLSVSTLPITVTRSSELEIANKHYH